MTKKDKIKIKLTKLIESVKKQTLNEGTVNLSKMVDGYVEAMLFGESDDNGESLDINYDSSDVSRDGYRTIKSRVARFVKDAMDLVVFALSLDRNYGEIELGRDLYFTTHGHGVGFWDRRELGEEYEDTGEYVGDLLTKIAEKNIHDQVGNGVYISDDGEVEVYGN
jgi:hypothetical protein